MWQSLTQQQQGSIDAACSIISPSSDCVTWLPDYGSALLAIKPLREHDVRSDANCIDLLLVGLDGWTFACER